MSNPLHKSYTDYQLKCLLRFIFELAYATVQVVLRDLTNWKGEVWTLDSKIDATRSQEHINQMPIKCKTSDFNVSLTSKPSTERIRNGELDNSGIIDDLLSEDLLMSVQTETPSDWLYKMKSLSLEKQITFDLTQIHMEDEIISKQLLSSVETGSVSNWLYCTRQYKSKL